MSQSPPRPYAPHRVRALFLSDLHLGARAARPRAIRDFLAAFEAEAIYLVGDVLDLWHGGKVHWSDDHEAVLSDLDARAGAGVRVVYLAGNHDAPLRQPDAQVRDGWELREALIHHAADGQRYLVLHGDQADHRLLRWHLMTRIGSRAEAALRALDDRLTRWFGPVQPPRASRIQRAIAAFNGIFVMGDRFERRLVGLAKALDAQGVICGHSHKPMLREVDGALYANCGDWVDSCTALTESHDGALRLVAWTAAEARAPQAARPGGAAVLER